VDVRVERDPVRALPRHDHDETLRGDAAELGERTAEVLDVLERVRRHDGVERVVAEGSCSMFASQRIALAWRIARSPVASDVHTDAQWSLASTEREVALAARDVEHGLPRTDATTASSDAG
jgi:hypothetical protein